MSSRSNISPDFDSFDVWKMVSARRQFEGQVPLDAFTRLRDLLLEPDGEVRYHVEFGNDELQLPSVRIRIDTDLPLLCQRGLKRFKLPLQIDQTLGLISSEADESALPEGYEPFLVPEDGRVAPLELVEDELIMAVPLLPVEPGTEIMEHEWLAPESETAAVNPFAALQSLKR